VRTNLNEPNASWVPADQKLSELGPGPTYDLPGLSGRAPLADASTGALSPEARPGARRAVHRTSAD
jgi:hypothetical protein